MAYRDNHGRGEPPVPRWDSPKVDEPAHGYLLRLASLNHQVSAKAFAETFGLNGRHLQPDECLEFALSLPAENSERLKAATPELNVATVKLMGEQFRRKDWSIDKRFFCPACLAEDGYHRCYWDLLAFRRCPSHDVPLVCEDIKRRPMPWWCASFAHSPYGNQIARSSISRQPSPCRGLEAYILGRLGLVQPISIPLLDDLPSMGDRLSAVEFIGLLRRHGLRQHKPQFKRTDTTRYAEIVHGGFDALAGGQEGLRAVFTSLANAAISAKPEARISTLKNLYGWAYLQARHSMGPFGIYCCDLMSEVAADHGSLSARSAAKVNGSGKWITITALAVEINLGARCVKRVAARLGCVDQNSDGRRATLLSAEHARLVRDTIATLLTRDEAASRLAITRSFFDKIVNTRLLAPFVKINGSTADCDRFRPEDIQSFEKTIVDRATRVESVPPDGMLLGQLRGTPKINPADYVRALLEGEELIIGRLSDRLGDVLISKVRTKTWKLRLTKHTRQTQAGIPKMEAASIFGDRYETFSGLLKILEIKPVEPGKRLAQKEVAEICKKYAPLRIYATALDCRHDQVAKRLMHLGVQLISFSVSGRCRHVVDRESARNALGLSRDPDADAGKENKFVSELCRRVATETVFKLESKLRGLSFRTGRGTFRLKVVINPYEGAVRTQVCYRHTGAGVRRIPKVVAKRAEIDRAFDGEVTWNSDDRGLVLEHRVCGLQSAEEAMWPAIINRVVWGMQMFKLVLEPPQRQHR